MKLKHVILAEMSRGQLKDALDKLELDGVDHRSADEMSRRLSRVHRATPEFLLAFLSDTEVKRICDQLELNSRGRRAELMQRLVAFSSAEALSRRQPIRTATGSPEPIEPEQQATWIRPYEVPMSGKPNKGSAPESVIISSGRKDVSHMELIWPGKYNEVGDRTEPARVALPFQVIEVIREGRSTRPDMRQGTLPLFAERPKGLDDGWRNKLIWGDSQLVGASLLEEFTGKVSLIYIDPPFDTGADFSFTVEIPGSKERLDKAPSIIERKAYRDTWGHGLDSYIKWFADIAVLLRDLLAANGSLYVHLDYHVCHYAKAILDEILGPNSFQNELIWKRTNAHNSAKRFGPVHDVIYYYARSADVTWNGQYEAYDESYLAKFNKVDLATGQRFQDVTLTGPGIRQGPSGQSWRGFNPTDGGRHWQPASYVYEKYKQVSGGDDLADYPLLQRFDKLDEVGLIYWPKKEGGQPRYKLFLGDSPGVPLQDVWSDIDAVNSQAEERTGYPTQKPERLLERIISASSKPGDLVLDLFGGSGTTAAVAERLGRRWVVCDLSRFAVHTTRKRLLDLRVADDQTKQERSCRPFEVLNLGKYERKHWQGLTFGNEPEADIERALALYARFILDLYKAQPFQGKNVHGKKGSALVHVGAVDAPVTISQIEDAAAETASQGVKELHILAWEYEMGLHDPITKHAKTRFGVNIRLLSIPREVMEHRAVEAGDIQFFDLSFLELELKAAGSGAKSSRSVRVWLKNFAIPSTDLIPNEVRRKIRKWSDYIDYWAVDWDFRNDTFVNQWQTYRTRQDGELALETPVHMYGAAGSFQILVKVVDIFGNDTSHLARWEAK